MAKHNQFTEIIREQTEAKEYAIIPKYIQDIIINEQDRITRLETIGNFFVIGIDGEDLFFPIYSSLE